METQVIFECSKGNHDPITVEIGSDGQYKYTSLDIAARRAGVQLCSNECAGRPGYKDGCSEIDTCTIRKLSKKQV